MPLTTTTTVISPPVTAVPGRRAGIRLGAEQAGRGPRLVPAATAPVPTAGGDVAPDRGGAAARHRHRCRRAVYRSVTMVGAVGGRAGSLPEPLSDRDFAAHDDSAILGQAEVFGLAGCVLREGEEQPFAPADHAGPVGAAQVDPGRCARVGRGCARRWPVGPAQGSGCWGAGTPRYLVPVGGPVCGFR